MADHKLNGRVLDARPDRIDFRDKTYNPPLVSLPQNYPSAQDISIFLPQYHQTSKILNQGNEGACTGFGLAAVINYITWERWMRSNGGQPAPGKAPTNVSPWMLYDNARVYDEWEGEEYSGSSCRGAMKGWHKHGVCREDLWPQRTRKRPRPHPEWQPDAASRPLGAYYRVDARSIADMQSAIKEVHAVYCSARVHAGWGLGKGTPAVNIAGLKVPMIKFDPTPSGGHAFAVVGYTEHGFIVQNSWGVDWGMKGFALLTYEDWVHNGDDAWVAAMAAPTYVATTAEVPAGRSMTAMQFVASAQAIPGKAGRNIWTESQAYEHSVVMGNDGKLLRRLIDTADVADNLRKVAVDLPAKALKDGCKHIVLYAHGGLNSEEAAIERAMRMGPWFEKNDIYPIFIVWRTSLAESIGQIGVDMADEFVKQREVLRARGLGDILDRAVDKLQDKFDKAFEAAAEKLIGKAVWSQMKQNAGAAADRDGGTRLLVEALRELRKVQGGWSLHMLGHSAGSILLGHMLDDLDKKSGPATVGFYAPACTVEFAVRHLGRAFTAGVIARGKLHVDNLTDQNERNDTVGPYGKSLLYLVSRAFEDPRNIPLLGLARCWKPGTRDLSTLKQKLGADFDESQMRFVRDWDEIASRNNVAIDLTASPQVLVKTAGGDQHIKASHGSIDNNIDVLNASLARILGTAKPKVEITDLSGF